MEMIGSYVNGNTIVSIYDDGTKARYFKDGETLCPEFPESMDLKITNCCDLGCPMCAESSTPDGQHADLSNPILDTIHPYTELAIGGGNPLEHPDLILFLERMKEKKVICNITVNQVHFMDKTSLLQGLVKGRLIYGLGVSVPYMCRPGLIDKLSEFPNAVVHTIAGYTPMDTFSDLAYHDINLLVLGYKQKGRGVYAQASKKRTQALENFLFAGNKFDAFKAIGFDNLAVKQLGVQRHMSKQMYDKLYMGDDGEFTMYVDLVNGTYSKSSTHPPRIIDGSSIDELFKKVKEEKDHGRIPVFF